MSPPQPDGSAPPSMKSGHSPGHNTPGAFSKPRRTRVRRQNLIASHFSNCMSATKAALGPWPTLRLVLHGWGPVWLLQRESMKTNEGMKDYVLPRQTFVKLWSYSLRLGREQASLQSLSQSLAALCWALLLKGQIGLASFPRFLGLDVSPSWLPSWLILQCLKVLPARLVSIAHVLTALSGILDTMCICLANEFLQLHLFISLVKPANGLWPILPPDRLRVYVPLARMALFPGEPVSALAP